MQQNNGTDLTLHDVQWDDESFTGSPYGGYRLGYWFDFAPNWGISGEWVHAKMIANPDQSVSVSGTRAGSPVSGTEPLGATFSELAFTYGHNLITLNLQYRWFLTAPASQAFWSRLEPYVGSGFGIARPYVRVTTATSNTHEYQEAGFAWQGFAGLQVRLAKYMAIFTEFKLSYADMHIDLPNGSLEVHPWSEHPCWGCPSLWANRTAAEPAASPPFLQPRPQPRVQAYHGALCCSAGVG